MDLLQKDLTKHAGHVNDALLKMKDVAFTTEWASQCNRKGISCIASFDFTYGCQLFKQSTKASDLLERDEGKVSEPCCASLGAVCT